MKKSKKEGSTTAGGTSKDIFSNDRGYQNLETAAGFRSHGYESTREGAEKIQYLSYQIDSFSAGAGQQ